MNTRPDRDLPRLLAEEPFVRALAQQLVIADADEVVQETWLHALRQGGAGVEEPRHWLARVARNVAANLRRGERRRRERQRTASVHEMVPSSAELAEREERRRALVTAVDALPAPLRTVVLLRWFDGLPPRRIAAELDMPVATVSTQLNRALHLLRQRLDAEHGGDRRAWLLALVPFAARPTGLPGSAAAAAPGWLAGLLAITTKNLIVAAAVLLALAGAWLFWPRGPASLAPATPGTASEPGDVRADLAPATGAPATDPARRLAVNAPGPVAATTGDLVVRVCYGDDKTAAPGVVLTLRRQDSDRRIDAWRQRTDETGTARFEKLPPGTLFVGRHGESGKRVDIVAERTTELDYVLAVGLTVTGIVVDAMGLPVAGATIEVTEIGRPDVWIEPVATTGADGRFRVRAAPKACLIGARAPRHAASPVKILFGRHGSTSEVRLVLGKDGGMVDGQVVDASGAPVANAVVIIGNGKVWGTVGYEHMPPFGALARSDKAGRFQATGLPVGAQPVQARAPRLAPWLGSCEITASLTGQLRIQLGPSATIRGIVRDATGSPVSRAEVVVGSWDDLGHHRALSAADGSFELTGLPTGDVLVRAAHDDLGRVEQRVRTVADAVSTCEVKLSRGLELMGRVVDGDGKPVAKASIDCLADAGGIWRARAETDAEGRFAVANCPETGTLRVTARAKDSEDVLRTGVDPKAGEVLLQLRAVLPRSVRITGIVVGPDSRPVVNAMTYAVRQSTRDTTGLQATDAAGRFEIGPLTPGSWQVIVHSSQHPILVSDVRELTADATWNLGTMTLLLGGTAVVRSTGDIAGAKYEITRAGESRHLQLGTEGERLRSSVLAPGDYRLLVSGQGVAVHAVPFSIRASEETVVEVRLQPGTAQRFEIVLPPASTDTSSVLVRVQRGSDLAALTWVRVQINKPSTTEMWLQPDDYRVEATRGALRGSATFTVGPAAGDPVRIELR